MATCKNNAKVLSTVPSAPRQPLLGADCVPAAAFLRDRLSMRGKVLQGSVHGDFHERVQPRNWIPEHFHHPRIQPVLVSSAAGSPGNDEAAFRVRGFAAPDVSRDDTGSSVSAPFAERFSLRFVHTDARDSSSRLSGPNSVPPQVGRGHRVVPPPCLPMCVRTCVRVCAHAKFSLPLHSSAHRHGGGPLLSGGREHRRCDVSGRGLGARPVCSCGGAGRGGSPRNSLRSCRGVCTEHVSGVEPCS